MGLSGENTGNFDSNYFVQKGNIKSCKLTYRVPNKFNAEEIKDVQLDIELIVPKKDGSTFDKVITISGNYKRDEQSPIVIGWGTAFKVKAFFNTLGLNDWTTDDLGVFPESLCKQVIGKDLWFVSYRSTVNDEGKRSYRTFKLFGKTAEDVETRFVREAAGDYPPFEYVPKELEEGFPYKKNTSFDKYPHPDTITAPYDDPVF